MLKNFCEAGILKPDFRLAEGIPVAAAHDMAEMFCHHNGKTTSWKPFEQFWKIDDLIHKNYEISKDFENTILNIFQKCSSL